LIENDDDEDVEEDEELDVEELDIVVQSRRTARLWMMTTMMMQAK